MLGYSQMGRFCTVSGQRVKSYDMTCTIYTTVRLLGPLIMSHSRQFVAPSVYQATHARHLAVQLYHEHTNRHTNKREGDLLANIWLVPIYNGIMIKGQSLNAHLFGKFLEDQTTGRLSGLQCTHNRISFQNILNTCMSHGSKALSTRQTSMCPSDS